MVIINDAYSMCGKMESRKYAMRFFGIDIKKIPGLNIGLTEEDEILLTKIREIQRRSRFVPIRRTDENFEIDLELSRQCCEHGWN